MKIWRPYTQMGLHFEFPRVVKAQGAKLFGPSGQSWLDMISSWWVITHGHCHPLIAEAISEQVKKLDQVIFANFSHDPSEKLLQELGSLLPEELAYAFFSDNGSTAVEVALKMIIQANKLRGSKEKKHFVTFAHSYHGDTVGAMSVSGRNMFSKPFTEQLFEVKTLSQGSSSLHPSKNYTDEFEEWISQHFNLCAGVILEPLLQGAGGMIVWPLEAVQRISRLCQEKGVPLIFDEVFTGFGRTGSLFALEAVGITPDFLCLSKGLTGGFLPMGLTLTSKTFFEIFKSSQKEKMFFHGHSFTGNPLSCAAAFANLQVFREENTLEKIRNIEKIHLQRLERFKNREHILDVRQKGVMAALEVQSANPGYQTQSLDEVQKKLFEQGVFIRPLGNILYALPPYSIQEDELHLFWDLIERALL